LCTSNLLEYSLFTFIIALVFVRVNAINLINFAGHNSNLSSPILYFCQKSQRLVSNQ
jgi:hypothetical protein